MASFSKSVVLEVYADFINNFSEAMDLAKCESKRKSAFGDFLKVQIFLPQKDFKLIFATQLRASKLKGQNKNLWQARNAL